MCGICGELRAEGAVARATIERMTTALTHRGPDDAGSYIDQRLGFGFRRLSIIDLAGGHQPMSDQDETVWAICNGEIYNFRELRTELRGQGHVFRTSSDVEVIVHGYKEWGVDVLSHLNGMFGLAIWDVGRQRLLVARDRLGIKPIYYVETNGTLRFASEIRALLAAEQTRPEADADAINLFLRYRYTPAPLTAFAGIRKLAAGTCLVVERDEPPKVERWWNPSPDPFDPMPTDDEALEELTSLYRRAVERQLVSDVPLGLLLSGGLDSGLLLALMNRAGSGWPTFSIGFGADFADDELAAAAETARLLGATNASVRLDRSQFEASIRRTIEALEEPVAASSIVPMYHLCARAREDVKVVLIGQGPDELFGGYLRHLGVRYGGAWRALPESLRQLLGIALERLPRNEAIRRGLASLDAPTRVERYQRVFSLMPAAEVDGLFKPGILRQAPDDALLECWRDLLPQVGRPDELGGLQILELRSSLPDELLMYGDKLSMAHALEARVPYLDHEIVEFVQRLGARFKVRRGVRKALHRDACRTLLPPGILQRKKRGFHTPVDAWFRSSMMGRLDQALRDRASPIFSILRYDSVRRLADEHQAGARDHSKVLFSLVTLAEWTEAFDVRMGTS